MKHHLQKLITTDEAVECALLMSSSEPWITLKRTYEDSLKILLDKSNDTYVLKSGQRITGFVVVKCQGSLIPYIQSIAIHPEYRRKGIGTKIIKDVEEIYSIQYHHIFLCVSSFNDSARKLYVNLGYKIVGELKDHIVSGHSEFLLSKSLRPVDTASPDAVEPIYVTAREDLMDLEFIYEGLKNTYWAGIITKENCIGRIRNSLSFGVFIHGKQIGFARVITDYFSFAYLADVFVDENHRGRGYSKLLMEYILNYPELTGIKWLLATKDAHELYKKYGFTQIENPERFMGKNGWKAQ
jgi:ribosomal protein S18 acetylase RimI-like enzyme